MHILKREKKTYSNVSVFERIQQHQPQSAGKRPLVPTFEPNVHYRPRRSRPSPSSGSPRFKYILQQPGSGEAAQRAKHHRWKHHQPRQVVGTAVGRLQPHSQCYFVAEGRARLFSDRHAFEFARSNSPRNSAQRDRRDDRFGVVGAVGLCLWVLFQPARRLVRRAAKRGASSNFAAETEKAKTGDEETRHSRKGRRGRRRALHERVTGAVVGRRGAQRKVLGVAFEPEDVEIQAGSDLGRTGRNRARNVDGAEGRDESDAGKKVESVGEEDFSGGRAAEAANVFGFCAAELEP